MSKLLNLDLTLVGGRTLAKGRVQDVAAFVASATPQDAAAVLEASHALVLTGEGEGARTADVMAVEGAPDASGLLVLSAGEWRGASRTNYFRVRDPAQFLAAMSLADVSVRVRKAKPAPPSEQAEGVQFALFAETADGAWPSGLDTSGAAGGLAQAVIEAAGGGPLDALPREDLLEHLERLITIHESRPDRLVVLQALALAAFPHFQDAPDLDDFEFHEFLAPYLADGEVAILQTVGTARLRAFDASARAIRNDGATLALTLDELMGRVIRTWGVEPTCPSY